MSEWFTSLKIGITLQKFHAAVLTFKLNRRVKENIRCQTMKLVKQNFEQYLLSAVSSTLNGILKVV